MNAADLLAALRGKRALVLGDLLLDRYVHARPERLSREAPLPVFVEQRSEERPGGAGNTALNLVALGASVELIAPLGSDPEGRTAKRQLESAGVGLDLAPLVPGYRTPLKTRVLAADQSRTPVQVLRLDREPAGQPSAAMEAALVRRMARAGRADLIFCADYGYGAISPASLAAARASGAPLVLDPRRTTGLGRGFLAATPNLPELADLCGCRAQELTQPEALERSARELADQLGIQHLLVTLGNRGMALFSSGQPAWAVPPSGSERVVDVSGAGDTAAASFGLALGAGLAPRLAMELANAAAGLVVLELGAVAVDPAALLEVWPSAPRARALQLLWAAEPFGPGAAGDSAAVATDAAPPGRRVRPSGPGAADDPSSPLRPRRAPGAQHGLAPGEPG